MSDTNKIKILNFPTTKEANAYIEKEGLHDGHCFRWFYKCGHQQTCRCSQDKDHHIHISDENCTLCASTEKSADVDKKYVLKKFLAGLATGAGVSSAVSLANYLVQLSKDRQVTPKTDADTITVYLPEKKMAAAKDRIHAAGEKRRNTVSRSAHRPQKYREAVEGKRDNLGYQMRQSLKSASMEKSADPRTVALAVLASLGGAGIGYGGVREIYNRLRKQELEKELELAQKSYLTSLGAPKQASSPSILDKLSGYPMAIWLLSAITSGALTNRVLENVFRESTDELKTPKPKRVVFKTVRPSEENLGQSPLTQKTSSAELRHLIKTAVTADCYGAQKFSWLTDTGLLPCAVAAKYGHDCGLDKSAAEVMLVEHDLSAEFNKCASNIPAFLAEENNRKIISDLISGNIPEAEEMFARDFHRNYPSICKLAQRVDVASVQHMIPAWVAADDSGCKSAEALDTKALYDTVVNPFEAAGNLIAPKKDAPKPAEKEDDAEIVGADENSRKFVSKNKAKIEKIVKAVEKTAFQKDAISLGAMAAGAGKIAPKILPAIGGAARKGWNWASGGAKNFYNLAKTNPRQAAINTAKGVGRWVVAPAAIDFGVRKVFGGGETALGAGQAPMGMGMPMPPPSLAPSVDMASAAGRMEAGNWRAQRAGMEAPGNFPVVQPPMEQATPAQTMRGQPFGNVAAQITESQRRV